MSFASFATLDEAWGGIGKPSPPAVPGKEKQMPASDPAPSDVEYSRSGAPIMDDIVNLYTPPVLQSADLPSPIPIVETGKEKEKKTDVKHVLRKGDDYDDSDGEERERRVIKRPWDSSARGGDQSSNMIELAAYVLSGVMLIFLFESFITIGGHIQIASHHY